jgi:hypothetical protein
MAVFLHLSTSGPLAKGLNGDKEENVESGLVGRACSPSSSFPLADWREFFCRERQTTFIGVQQIKKSERE